MTLSATIARSTPLSATAVRAATTPTIARRAFTSAPQRWLKEDKIRSPDEAEVAKQEQLREQKEGAGRWHEELASNSESNVKADREAAEVGDKRKHMEDLQELGKKKSEKGEL